jgi:hypothetical protein
MAEDRTLRAGTVVHVCGVPVALADDVVVKTHAGDWNQIEAALARRAEPHAAAVPRRVAETSEGHVVVPEDEPLLRDHADESLLRDRRTVSKKP